MIDQNTIIAYAQRLAQDCIEDWVREGWWELNNTWGTEFSDEELRQIVALASTAVAVVPDGSADHE